MGSTTYLEAFVLISAIRRAIAPVLDHELASFEMDAYNGDSVIAIASAGTDPLEKQRSPKPIFSEVVAVSNMTVTSIRLRYRHSEVSRIDISLFVKAGDRLAMNWILTDQIPKSLVPPGANQ